MKIHKCFCLFMMLMLGLSFISCSKDDGDEVFDDDTENGNGQTQTSYTLSQLAGYWVNAEQWRLCKQNAASLPVSGKAFSDTYLEDKILSDGVDAYYISAGEKKAYIMWITVTTTKYANNDAAGNKVLKSWSCLDGRTVYFMNVVGSKENKACSVWEGSELKVGTSYFPILSPFVFIGPNNARYEKVSLSF